MTTLTLLEPGKTRVIITALGESNGREGTYMGYRLNREPAAPGERPHPCRCDRYRHHYHYHVQLDGDATPTDFSREEFRVIR